MSTESQTKSVLVVDDSRVSRMFIRSHLLQRFPNWNVVEAGTGDEALALARQSPFDFCTMDINMPGMLGTQAAEELRQLQPALRIVLFSANVQETQQQRAAQIGVSFVAKPVTPKSVGLALDYFLGAG